MNFKNFGDIYVRYLLPTLLPVFILLWLLVTTIVVYKVRDIEDRLDDVSARSSKMDNELGNLKAEQIKPQGLTATTEAPPLSVQ
jgi:cell division protein FtsL